MGCRRVLIDAGYLEALHRPNMSLRRNDIEAIVEDGIITKAGMILCVERRGFDSSCETVGEKLSFDVIVCATGFAIVCSI
jgi:hypothetical protein